MSSAAIKFICIQILMAMFSLLASSKSTPAQTSADARALERLKWMRQNQGNLWNVNPDEGAFLRDLAEKVHAKEGLEIGTSNGYSSIWIGMGLRKEGGHLLTLEINEGRAKLAQANFRAAGLDSVITLKLGDALEEVPKRRRRGRNWHYSEGIIHARRDRFSSALGPKNKGGPVGRPSLKSVQLRKISERARTTSASRVG